MEQGSLANIANANLVTIATMEFSEAETLKHPFRYFQIQSIRNMNNQIGEMQFYIVFERNFLLVAMATKFQ